MIVEDSEIISERLECLLSQANNIGIVFTTGNGVMALEFLKQNEADIVLLDIQINGLNGIEVLKEIKTSQPDIIVYVLTNYATDSYKQAALGYGANGFFDKSSEFEKAIDEIIFLSEAGRS